MMYCLTIKVYFVSELSLGELLEYHPELYEVRRAALNGGAA